MLGLKELASLFAMVLRSSFKFLKLLTTNEYLTVFLPVMNPTILNILKAILPIIESAIQSEGPVVLEWIEAELQKLAAKYAAK
jgi:hypothetical protein